MRMSAVAASCTAPRAMNTVALMATAWVVTSSDAASQTAKATRLSQLSSEP